jgi:hypothetical protein
MRTKFAASDDVVLVAHYQSRGCAWCAERLARTTTSVYQRALRLGLTQRLAFATDQQIADAIREWHPVGWGDKEISIALGDRIGCKVNRHRVGVIRRSLGLASNALSDHRRQKVAARTQQQLDAAGVESLAELRGKVWDAWKQKHGWPTTLTARAVQAAEIMFRRGPMTRVELCVAMGIDPKARTAPKSNAKGGTVLAELQRHGLVSRLRKAMKVPASMRVHAEPPPGQTRNNQSKYLDLYFLDGVKDDHVPNTAV